MQFVVHLEKKCLKCIENAEKSVRWILKISGNTKGFRFWEG